MPKNKHALIRYKIIDKMLTSTSRRYPSKEDILDKLRRELKDSISGRTLENDFDAMKTDGGLGFYAPIRYSRKYGGYYYEDSQYSIAKLPISGDDRDALDMAALILKQYDSLPILKEFANVVTKLQTVLDGVVSNSIEARRQMIQFEESPNYKGLDLIQPLLRAVEQQYRIDFNYQGFLSTEKRHEDFEPLLLKEWRQMWYVIGRYKNGASTKSYPFALDRITNLEVKESEGFTFPYDFNARDHYAHAYGIYRMDGKPERVKLRVYSKRIRGYMRNNPFHASQKITKESEGFMDIELRVFPTPDLEGDILRFCPEIQVISPKTLRDNIAKRIQDGLCRMSDNQ